MSSSTCWTRFAGWCPAIACRYPYDWLERRAVRRADLILTLSQSARTDIERVLGVSRAKIRVAYLGAPPLDPAPPWSHGPASRVAPSHSPIRRPPGSRPTSCSSAAPRSARTSTTALEAFKAVEGYELRVVGANTASPVHDARSDQSGVRWLGFIDEEELVEPVPSCHRARISKPLRGIWAAAAGGDGAPHPGDRLQQLLDTGGRARRGDPRRSRRRGGDCGTRYGASAADETLREELIERGVEVVSSFSWDETARATVAAYEELGVAREATGYEERGAAR